MDIHAYFRSCYDAEIERKDRFVSGLGLPVGMLVLLISSVVYLIGQFQTGNNAFVSNVVAPVFVLIVAPAIILSGYYYSRAFFGYSYQVVPSPLTMLEFLNDLKGFYRHEGKDPSDAEAELKGLLIERYAHAAHYNFQNNKKRAEDIYHGNRCLLATLCIVTLAALLHLVSSVFFLVE